MLIAPITITTAVGASRNICHEMLLIYEWTQKPQPQPQPQWQRWRQRRAPEAQNVLIIKIQNGGRGEEEGEREGKVKLQRTLNLVGSQFTSPLFPSPFTLLHGTVIQWRLCLMHSTVSAAVVNVTSQPTAAATATVTATPTATGLNRRLRPEAETSSDYKCNYRGGVGVGGRQRKLSSSHLALIFKW